MIGLEKRRHVAEGIRRIFFGDEPGEIVPPGFILEEDRPEWAFSLRQLFWTTGPVTVAAGAAGNFGRLQVKNPVGSNRIVVVTYGCVIGVGPGSSQDLSENGANIVAGVVACTGRDQRQGLNPGATARPVSTQNALDNSLPATSGIILDRRSPGGATTDVIFSVGNCAALPFMLAPGGRLELTNRVGASAATILLAGYEVPVIEEALGDT